MTFAWIDLGDGRSVYRSIADLPRGPRSSLPCPNLNRDGMDPVQSMADGKVYDSKSAIRATYKAGGNPQGIEYHEVGNDPGRMTPRKPAADRKGIKDSLRKASAEWRQGRRPRD